MKYVALDFETANSSAISACAIGIAVFEDDKIVHTSAYLIKPPKEFRTFNWYNIKVHGIKRAMVVNSPNFGELWHEIRSYIEDSVIVCHNASFDTSVLVKLLEYYKIEIPTCRYICTVKIAQKVWADFYNHKLDTVSENLGIMLNHHEAGSDALASGLILQKAMKKMECSNVDELAKKVGMQIGVISKNNRVSCSTSQEILRQKQKALEKLMK